MSSTKRYNLINNSLGWLCFIIAAVSYVLTIEPTASFWDCPEFITQGYKLEVGHPPGNPIFMLTARFFITVMGAETGTVAAAVNTMNALLSAATILLLFWTVTHLMRRLLAGYKPLGELTAGQQVVIFGAGLVGALSYAWSDTFWYSAVEGEVYAFSSFCTALVFWLILKWENRADLPHSDRYLVLIAYVIGVSIAVHLLNLLCIPAIVLVFYYRKFAKPTATGSVLALLVSFAIVAVILYGLVPGFIEVAQYSELLCVNVFHMDYNSGVLIYTLLTLATFIWAIYELYVQRSAVRIKIAFALSVLMSGIPFIGSSLIIPLLIMSGLVVWLIVDKKIHARVLNVVTLSIFVIFIGYSSYALLLIRSAADTPVNQNAPDNVFDLGSYLNREQYGEAPLLYGTSFASVPLYDRSGRSIHTDEMVYTKAVPNEDGTITPHYDRVLGKRTYTYAPELNMLFPRMYDSRFRSAYMNWAGITDRDLVSVRYAPQEGSSALETVKAPTFGHNLSYFVNYQLVHMYFRYFMWNFAGRQNDLQGNGELNRGNWITGISALDRARLGDQSSLPENMGTDNKGHNVFYMLPLLLGLAGLLWQSFKGETGIRQFWVVFFLFFMTGIAIVLYLNQTPGQPRERDYAFAGSFYAFAIWIGLGVGAVAAGINRLFGKRGEPATVPAIIASVICLIVPLQMVSQTWDDHDRSGRFTARDFGMNYLSSLEPNAIIFTNGDNDTFPLWYAQEVEGYRTDVRVINLSYLTQPWYVKQHLLPAYEAAPINVQATERIIGQDRRSQGLVLWTQNEAYNDPVDVREFIADYYSPMADSDERHREYTNVYPGMSAHRDIPFAMPVRDLVIPGDSAKGFEDIIISDFQNVLMGSSRHPGNPVMDLTDAMILDIISSSAANGWDRPIYFANTVPNDYYLGLQDYMYNTGMAQQVLPRSVYSEEPTDVNDRAYANIMERFRWGGLDEPGGEDVYLDETVQRMVFSTRHSVYTTAVALVEEGKYREALNLLNLLYEKLPAKNAPYDVLARYMATLFIELGDELDDPSARQRGLDLLESSLTRSARDLRWMMTLTNQQFATLSASERDDLIAFQQTSYADYDVPASGTVDLIELYVNAVGEEAAQEAIDRVSAAVDIDLIGYLAAYNEVRRAYFADCEAVIDGIYQQLQNAGSDYTDTEALYSRLQSSLDAQLTSAKSKASLSLLRSLAPYTAPIQIKK